MLETIYSLAGKARSGKTTTLSLLIDMLKSEEQVTIVEEEIIPATKGKTDKYAIFKYKDLYIGVLTIGDYSRELRKHFPKLKEKCNIIFCATRTKQGTTQYIKSYTDVKKIRIDTMRISDKKALDIINKKNITVAEFLFNLI